jgi:hypothetical protein
MPDNEATDSKAKRGLGQFERLDQTRTPEEKPLKVWAKDLKFPVAVFREVFRNKDGKEGSVFRRPMT